MSAASSSAPSSSSSARLRFDSPAAIPVSELPALFDSLRARYTAAGQQHVMQFLPELDEAQQQQLAFDMLQVPVEELAEEWKKVQQADAAASQATPAQLTPFPHSNVSDLAALDAATRQRWYRSGLKLIAEGKVGALLMAGGQGTRLGSSAPKGCYDIGLLSNKSLFQLQAERLLRVRQLAAEQEGKSVDEVHVRWYIMTSIATHTATVSFFRSHSFFGVPDSDCFFFQQSELPSFDLQSGRMLLEGKAKLSLSPNGNGGIFEGAKRQGALEDMQKHGISYIHVYGVDNVLARVADPTFIGFAVQKGADCANKVVLKSEPSEKVGVMCLRDGRPSVVEYSELPRAMSEMRGEDGALLYSAANIVQHFFTIEFLQKHADTPLIYHMARKAIRHVDPSGSLLSPSAPNGAKLEMFVFDSFERAERMQCMAVRRDEEFAPVKNANAPGVTDTPSTARRAVANLHAEWIKKAGGKIAERQQAEKDACVCEISPLVSYAGEGLESRVQGKSLQLPLHIDTHTQL